MSDLASEATTDRSKPAIRGWLTERIAFYLELPLSKVDPEIRLVEIGLDSVYALTLCGDVEERYDLLVEPTMAWDHPTVNALAAYLHSELTGTGHPGT